jgi:UDP-N-acetyl-2-amino-2-deoxyglucuronate dehydrogenase
MTTVAVIGCGDVSTVHLGAIAVSPDIDLAAVCDTDPGRLAAAVASLGVPGFADHRRLIEEIRPDVVHICTPHHQHVSVAIDCLERGVNVIMEKPLAHTSAEGQRLVGVAEHSAAKVAVCFQNRYNATTTAMHELLTSGELGTVFGASATVMWRRTAAYYAAKPWRGRRETSGGGLLMNQAVHTVDLIQWLLGDVTDVRGHASTRLLGDAIEVEDTAEMLLTHANGARTVFYGTLANAVNSPVMIDVHTEAATLSLRGDLTVTYTDGRSRTVPERLASSIGRPYWGTSHELLIRDFYARLGEPGPFWISPAEAAKSLDIIQRLYATSATGSG